jgi:hypothetical protein
MQSKSSFPLLRRALAVDAVSSAAMGLALLMLAPTLAPLLNLPLDLLREAGVILLPFAALVAYLASREQPASAGVWVVIALNAVWSIDSIVLLLSGWVEPTGLGYAFVIGQAVVVGVFAQLEYIGLRRASLPATS